MIVYFRRPIRIHYFYHWRRAINYNLGVAITTQIDDFDLVGRGVRRGFGWGFLGGRDMEDCGFLLEIPRDSCSRLSLSSALLDPFPSASAAFA